MIDDVVECIIKEKIEEDLRRRNIISSKSGSAIAGAKVIDFKNESIEEIIEKYANIKKQFFIVNRPMKVTYTNEILSKKIFLTKSQNMILNEIERKIKEGKSIKPYLSNNLYLGKFSKEDELLSKHNIYHLHLNEPDKKEHFVKRTNKLLFITYSDDEVCFLEIRKHPVGDEWNNILSIKLREEYLDKKIEAYCSNAGRRNLNYSDYTNEVENKIFGSKDEMLERLSKINIKNLRKEVKNGKENEIIDELRKEVYEVM